jgi:hypothetical protein
MMRKLFITKILAVALLVASFTTDSFALSRIRFASGRSSATVVGTLRAGASTKYVLRASEYQTMTVVVRSGNDDIRFDIVDKHGRFEYYYDGYARIETDANGDHWITLKNQGRGATRYSMTVTVR